MGMGLESHSGVGMGLPITGRNHRITGRDSLLIEVAYRLHHQLLIDPLCPQSIIATCRDHSLTRSLSVLGGLYKLDIVVMQLESIYWGGKV